MTDLTPQQYVAVVTRSLKATWQRMAERYRGVAADQPAPEPRRLGPPTYGFSEDAGPGGQAAPRR